MRWDLIKCQPHNWADTSRLRFFFLRVPSTLRCTCPSPVFFLSTWRLLSIHKTTEAQRDANCVACFMYARGETVVEDEDVMKKNLTRQKTHTDGQTLVRAYHSTWTHIDIKWVRWRGSLLVLSSPETPTNSILCGYHSGLTFPLTGNRTCRYWTRVEHQ